MVRKVGIIGAGIMGAGIAQVCALAGIEVVLQDISEERVQASKATIAKALKKPVDLSRNPDQSMLRIYWNGGDALSRIATTLDFDDFSDCDLILEAATENEEIKKGILKGAARFLKPTAILATNTSSISISKLASYSGVPERFLGIHFMNPAPVMKLVEIISAPDTSEDTIQTVIDFLDGTLGKTTVEASDSPGFILNRILIPEVNEGIYALYEGVGTVKGIDTAMKLGSNQPMGPLELADLIGLDTVLSIMQVLEDGLGEKYRPCPLLMEYVREGRLGRKSGKGFYDYSITPPVPLPRKT